MTKGSAAPGSWAPSSAAPPPRTPSNTWSSTILSSPTSRARNL
uniref:Uncharacterized protein n=1 Tax=Rhizophora mucronata TaxID=61149 RepID=A0A2P2Q4D1_RHIMU